jgi:hypothetical protein
MNMRDVLFRLHTIHIFGVAGDYAFFIEDAVWR